MIVKALMVVFREEQARPDRNVFSTIRRCLAAARAVLFPDLVAYFNSIDLMGKLKHPTRNLDPLYFLTYRYYVSKRFTLRQRAQVAMDHHKYESSLYNCEYMEQAYRSDGVVLWERSFDDQRFTIVLTAGIDNRAEGDLSVILSVNGDMLAIMSFCYLRANVFGLPPHMTMLVSRNQTIRTSSRAVFDKCFKQNTPHLFCLAAICGIGAVNEFGTIFGIKHDAQIIYKESLDTGFRNSYTALWEKFDAAEIDGQAFMLSVPLSLRPVALVGGDHRRRARARRQWWDEILHSTRSNMARYRRLPHSSVRFQAASPTEPLSRTRARSAALSD